MRGRVEREKNGRGRQEGKIGRGESGEGGGGGGGAGGRAERDMRGGAAARLRQRLAPRRLLDAARRTVSCALASRVALLVPLLLCTRLSSVVLKRRAQPWDDLSSDDRRDLIEALRERVTPPPPYRIGGEVLEAEAYQRFLQVQDWSVPKAAEMLTKDLEWRSRIRPREIHPRNIPTACSQRGWLVLMRHHGSNTLVDVDENPAAPPVNHTSHHHRAPFSRWHLPGAHSFHFPHPHFHLPHAFHRHGHNRPSLHPPHVKPAFAHWVYTRHGMPVTYINVKAWHPELFKSKDECTRFCAYHMEHYIRRMPIRRGRYAYAPQH